MTANTTTSPESIDLVIEEDCKPSIGKSRPSPDSHDSSALKFRDATPIELDPDRLHSHFPGGIAPPPPYIETHIYDAVREGPSFGAMLQLVAAEAKIAERHSGISWAGKALDDTQPLGQGKFVRHFENADIYYSAATGACEIHGDIRAKYMALGGPGGLLGIPITSEKPANDPLGKFNDFERGSIYWSPSTGPMMVHGALRDFWRSQGGETGHYGYPVTDQHQKVFNDPSAQPAQYWCQFQRDGIVASKYVALPALTPSLNSARLRAGVRQYFDDAVHDQGFYEVGPFGVEIGQLGIEGPANSLGVSDWRYGFWQSGARRPTYEIHGFMKHPIVPDATFRLEITLEFGLAWPNSFAEPAWRTLTVSLAKLHVHASGLGNELLSDRLMAEIKQKFKVPLAVRDIPTTNSGFFGISMTAGGDLQFLLERDLGNPDYTLNGVFFQNALDSSSLFGED